MASLTACATIAAPFAPNTDRWQSDLKPYQDHLQRFQAQTRQLLEEFQALRANPNFPVVA